MKNTLYTLYSVNLLHLLQDVEKGELHSNVAGLSPSICSRPTSSSRTSTSAESRVELEDKLRNNCNRTNVSNIAVEVEIRTSNNEPIGTLNVTVRTKLESCIDIIEPNIVCVYVHTYVVYRNGDRRDHDDNNAKDEDAHGKRNRKKRS